MKFLKTLLFENEKLNQITDFLVFYLVITNVYIFFYNEILRFLNIRFPAPLPAEFTRVGAVPEPFEISLYLFSLISVAVFIVIGRKFIRESSGQNLIFKKGNIFIIFKYSALFFLLMLFVSNIGSYPMAHDHYPYPPLQNTDIYKLSIFIFIAVFILITLEVTFLRKIIRSNKKIFILFIVFIIVFIGIATLEPGFPIAGHDYSFFFGPIWEVAHGKTIYTQAPSLYGFLSILFLTVLYNLRILDPWHIPALIWIFYILEYFLCFYLIYRISSSLTLALIGLFSILTVNYFSLFALPGSFPQIGPMRWLPLVIFLYLFYKLKKIDSRILLILIPILSFWVIDSGIALYLSYLFSLFLLVSLNQLSLSKALKTIVLLGLSSAALFIVINLIQISFGFKLINPLLIVNKLKEFAKAGFGMYPIDSHTYFWTVSLLFFLSIGYIVRKKVIEFSDKFLLLTANISLFASVYFVGRSHPHNLFHISLFFLLNLFIFIGLLWKKILSNKSKLVFAVIIFFLTIVYPAYERQEVITEMIKEKMKRFATQNIFLPETKNMLENKYKDEISLIKNKLPESKIVILANDDTYLFYLVNKKNFIHYNPQLLMIDKTDEDLGLQDVLKECPKKIVTNCQIFNKCSSNSSFNDVGVDIQPHLLVKIQQQCANQYKPVDCTNQLCIAEVNK